MKPSSVSPFTLALLKPDLLVDPFAVKRVLQRIKEAGLWWTHQRTLTLTAHEAHAFYKEHEGRFFYNRLVGHMTSGPVMALLLHRPAGDAVGAWRALMGPTRPVSAQISHPNSLRSLYGMTDVRNACHGSDGSQSALREARFFFPHLDFQSLGSV